MKEVKQPIFIIKSDFECFLLILYCLGIGYGLFKLFMFLHFKFGYGDNFLILVLPLALLLVEILMIGLIVDSRITFYESEKAKDQLDLE
ncbi:hypothetical protein ABBZ21_19805 [Acinetobacter baumannii]|uniref:hypothetical protein n=1 Tax=Acinetobacter baumannii TaxID=470 RepID=UPI00385B2FB6